MAHMMTRMTRMTRWLDSHDSLARWLAVCQDPNRGAITRHGKPFLFQPTKAGVNKKHVCCNIFIKDV